MSYCEIIHVEIYCDFPGCDQWLLFGDEESKNIVKMMRAINWTGISFPSEERYRDKNLDFCPACKYKDLPEDEKHDHVYMRKTKKGKPSDRGSILECYFCAKIKT